VREAETARASQRLAEVELDQARTELAALGRPVGFVGAFRVLVGIAVTGIVLPLAVMSNGAYQVPAAGRVVLVSLFVLALIAFMLFLRAEIKRATDVAESE
jgi:sugar phosphate permease